MSSFLHNMRKESQFKKDTGNKMRKLAVLDDYPRASMRLADWSAVEKACEITIFDRHLGLEEAKVVLQNFEILCTLRERMAFPRSLIESLPNLKLIAATGPKHHR